MVNTELLKRHIEYSGIKLTVLAIKIGVCRTTLWSRLNGTSEFKSDEIKDICRVLRLNEKERITIFNTDPLRNDIQRRKGGN